MKARSADVMVAELNGEAVLLHSSTGVYFGLSVVGLFIWKLISHEGLPLRRIVERVAEEYGKNREDISDDVLVFVQGLIDNGLIEELSIDEPQ